MSAWQAILIGGWVLALIVGADWRLAIPMACNMAISAIWPDQIGIVGLADLATIAALSMISQRGQVIAALYVLCAVINAGGALLGLPADTTYAILDPIGWAMLAVLANVDAGIRRISHPARHFVRRHSFGLVDFMAQRGYVLRGVALDNRKDQR